MRAGEDAAEGDEEHHEDRERAQSRVMEGEEDRDDRGGGGVAAGHGPEVAGSGLPELPGVEHDARAVSGDFVEGEGGEGCGLVEFRAGAADGDFEEVGDDGGEDCRDGEVLEGVAAGGVQECDQERDEEKCRDITVLLEGFYGAFDIAAEMLAEFGGGVGDGSIEEEEERGERERDEERGEEDGAGGSDDCKVRMG